MVIDGAKGKISINKKITFYSNDLIVLMRLIDMATPKYTRACAATELLDAAVKKHFPELYQRMVDAGLPDIGELPVETYWPAEFHPKSCGYYPLSGPGISKQEKPRIKAMKYCSRTKKKDSNLVVE